VKARVSVSKLVEVLELVRRVPSDKTTIPSCAGVKLEFFEDNTLKVHANNTREWVTATLKEGVEVDSAGVMVVPAKRFVGWVKTFSVGKVLLSESEKLALTLNLSVGKARTRVKCYAESDFPPVPVIDEVGKDGAIFHVKSDDFQGKLRSVSWARKQERDFLLQQRAINLLCRADGTAQVRTFNGIGALSMANLELENPKPRENELNVYIPDEFLKVAIFTDDDIEVVVVGKRVQFSQDNLLWGGLLLVGMFPDASSLFKDKGNLPKVSLPVEAFQMAVNRLGVMLENAAFCTFDMTEASFTIKSNRGGQDSASEQVPVSIEGFEKGVTKSVSLSLPDVARLLSTYTGSQFVFEFSDRLVIFSGDEVGGDWVGFMAPIVTRKETN